MDYPEKGSVFFVVKVTLVAALGGLLFGYDTAVINGAIGFLTEQFALSAPQEGWVAACTLLGCALGAACAGMLSDAWGRKKVLIVSAILFLVSAIGTAIPKTMMTFIIFRIIGGLGVGAASMTSPMYIAEISPARIRGRMVSLNQFAIIFGMLIVYFVNLMIEGMGDHQWDLTMGWRWMFGSEAIPALVLLGLLFLVPESPRWLMQRGRELEAMMILAKADGLAYAKDEQVEIKQSLSLDHTTLRKLICSPMRLVLVLGISLAVLTQVTGINVFLYFGTEIFKEMGSETTAALRQTLSVGAVNLLFTILAIWTVDRLGRKPLLIIGSSGMGICLLAMGLAAYYQASGAWLLIFVLGYIACFAMSVGPVGWVLLSEMFPMRIRARAMAAATVSLWLANFVVSQTFAVMNRNAWLIDHFHHGFPFFIYAVFCVVMVVVVIKWIPETKGRSLEDIETFWRPRTKEGNNE